MSALRLLAVLCSALTAHSYLLPTPAMLRTRLASFPRSAGISMEEAAPQVSIAERATAAIDTIMGMMGEGVDPPTSLIDLKNSVSAGDPMDIGDKMYLLLCEQSLDYDLVDGTMVKSTLDYSNKDDPKVKEKIGYVYSYGINMYKMGLVSGDRLKDAVLSKVASRVSMTGEELDKWLEIPAVQ